MVRRAACQLQPQATHELGPAPARRTRAHRRPAPPAPPPQVALENGTALIKTTSGQEAKVVRADLDAGSGVVHLVDVVRGGTRGGQARAGAALALGPGCAAGRSAAPCGCGHALSHALLPWCRTGRWTRH